MLDFRDRGYLHVRGLLPSAMTQAALQAVDRWQAPEPERPGPQFGFPLLADLPELRSLLDLVLPVAAELLGEVSDPQSVQIARTHPPFPRGAGRPHVDGSTGTPGGRPDSFSLLAGIPLTDQRQQGGLWVWPGSHREHAAHFRGVGPAGFWSGDPGYPDVTKAKPVRLPVSSGDLILAHYLLGHCPGGVSTISRTTLYARLSHPEHAASWRDALTDPDRDFAGMRATLG